MKNRILSSYSSVGIFLGLVFGVVTSPTTLVAVFPYSTGFESVQGFTGAATNVSDPFVTDTLTGKDNWTDSNGAGSGATGVVTAGLGTGQAAYIGYHAPLAPGDVYAWEPINLNDPVGNGTPLIRFSVDFKVVGSTNGQNDDFYFQVYSTNVDPLCGIDFSTTSGNIFDYPSGNAADGTTTQIVLGTKYNLTMDINFSTKKFLANIDGNPVFSAPRDLNLAASVFNLGDIDPSWGVKNSATPGNNYMVFDNYSILAIPEPSTVAMALVGAALLGVTMRRRRVA